MRNKRTNLEENFVFRFFRDYYIFPKRKVIPLQLNRDQDGQYSPVTTSKIRLREMFVDENGDFCVRLQRLDAPGVSLTNKLSAEQAAQEFFEDVLKECFGLKQY